MKVFISYAREDYEIAERLFEDLSGRGLAPWLDTKCLRAGQRWKPAITEAITQCKFFVALLSESSVSKQGFFQKELKTALDIVDCFPEQEIFFIPVRLDNCQPSGEKLAELHWADLFPSYEAGLKEILMVLLPEGFELSAPEKRKSEKVRMGGKSVEIIEKPMVTVLRSEPIVVTKGNWIEKFGLEENRRSEKYIENDFRDNGDGTVTDRATGLMWEKSGSDYWISYFDAKTYVEKRNRERFAGHTDWRLPTVDELKSLLTPERNSETGLYIDPIFDSKQRWCWTSDTFSFGGTLVVFFGYGNVYWDKPFNDSYVRTVRPRQ